MFRVPVCFLLEAAGPLIRAISFPRAPEMTQGGMQGIEEQGPAKRCAHIGEQRWRGTWRGTARLSESEERESRGMMEITTQEATCQVFQPL